MSRGMLSGALAVMAVFIVMDATGVQAQWQRVETLEGISVQDFAITAGGTLYASSDRQDGLYYSTDAGKNWLRRDDLDTLYAVTLESAGEDLYMLTKSNARPTDPRRIFRLRSPLSPLEEIAAPHEGDIGTICCTNDGWLYVLTADNPATDSVHVSTDGGQSWSGVCRTYTAAPFGKNGLRIDARKRLWTQSESSVAWYDHASSSWIDIGGGGAYPSFRQRLFFQDNGDLFISGRMAIYRYDAATSSLHALFAHDPLPVNGHEVWVAGDGRLLVSAGTPSVLTPSAVLAESNDDGETWSVIGDGLEIPLSFLGEHDGVIFANHAGMLVCTRDHGRTFQSCSRGLASKDVWKFGVRGNNVVVQAWRYAISTDSGVNWNNAGICPGGNLKEIQTSLDGTWYEDMGAFRISRDGGRTWDAPWGVDPEYTPSDLLVLDDAVILSLMVGSILRSTDNGQHWSQTYSSDRYVTNLIEAHGVLYGLSGSSLLRSTDRGASWQTSALPAADNPMLIGNDRVLLLSASSVLWTSTDLGTSWTPLPLDKLSQGIKTFAVSRQGLFAALRDESKPDERRRDVILSVDDGKSWQSITGNLPEAFTRRNFTPAADLAFTFSDRLLVNVRGQGLYVFDDVPLGVGPEQTRAESMDIDVWPTIASLEIRYRVQAPNPTSVTIHSAMGVEMHRAAGQPHGGSTHVDVRAWPAGNYFLRATAANGSVVREFVVLR